MNMERELAFVEKDGILYQFVNDQTDLISDKFGYMWKVVESKPKTEQSIQAALSMAKAHTFRQRLRCGYQAEINNMIDST